jgi:hypothetical protein
MLAYLFLLVAIAIRFTPHPWSFTPVAACLLFFGARGPRRMIWLPLVLLAASDVTLNQFVYQYPLLWDQFVTWAWYAATLWLGTKLKDHQKPAWLVGGALASSVSFFVISNFAIWAATNMYPHTWDGLMTSYTLGLPFFRRGAEGDLLFTGIFFAVPVVAHYLAEYFDKGSDYTAAA